MRTDELEELAALKMPLVRVRGQWVSLQEGDIENALELYNETEDGETAVRTVERFNAACDPGEFDPATLDGNATEALDPPKSNWATPLNEPPYYAYPVTGGITFGFGGVEITTDAEVRDGRGRVIPGFYAAGNATGDLFYDNYPGGTGLMNAAVYGKIAAEKADAYIG